METFNPVVSGLVNAMSLASMFQRMSLEKEQIERQKHKDKREEQLQDFSLKNKLLNEGAKTVSPDGRYSQNIDLPQLAPGDPAVPQGPTSMATSVPVDPGRTMTAPDGTKFYIPTRQEQFEDAFPMKMRELQATTDVKTQAAIAESIAKLQGQMAVNDHTQDRIDRRTFDQDMRKAGENQKNRDNQRAITDANNKTRTNIVQFEQGQMNNRSAATNATSRANNADTNATHSKNTDKMMSGGAESRRREVNGRDEKITDLENEYRQLSGMLRNGGTFKDGNKTVDLEVKKDGSMSAERKVLEQKVLGIRRKLKLLRGQNDQAEAAGGGGGTWESYKSGLGQPAAR